MCPTMRCCASDSRHPEWAAHVWVVVNRTDIPGTEEQLQQRRNLAGALGMPIREVDRDWRSGTSKSLILTVSKPWPATELAIASQHGMTGSGPSGFAPGLRENGRPDRHARRVNRSGSFPFELG